MILNAIDGRPLPIYGDGGNVRDWLHVEDHCAGLLLVLQRGQPGEKYNVGGGNERTNLEIDRPASVTALERLRPAASNPALNGRAGYSALKTFVPDRPGHDRRYAIDATKIAPRARMDARIIDLMMASRPPPSWYSDHRDWCDEVQARSIRQRNASGWAGDIWAGPA